MMMNDFTFLLFYFFTFLLFCISYILVLIIIRYARENVFLNNIFFSIEKRQKFNFSKIQKFNFSISFSISHKTLTNISILNKTPPDPHVRPHPSSINLYP